MSARSDIVLSKISFGYRKIPLEGLYCCRTTLLTRQYQPFHSGSLDHKGLRASARGNRRTRLRIGIQDSLVRDRRSQQRQYSPGDRVAAHVGHPFTAPSLDLKSPLQDQSYVNIPAFPQSKLLSFTDFRLGNRIALQHLRSSCYCALYCARLLRKIRRAHKATKAIMRAYPYAQYSAKAGYIIDETID